jgi:hypothetical protein
MNAPTADELAESQATLNEYVAYMIMGQAFNEMRYADRAVTALLNFNQAAGFELCEAMPPDDANTRQLCARTGGQRGARPGQHEPMGCGACPS